MWIKLPAFFSGFTDEQILKKTTGLPLITLALALLT